LHALTKNQNFVLENQRKTFKLTIMQLNMGAFHDSPEERERLKRQATQKRLKILSVFVVVAVLARLFIKDPPPPKPQPIKATRYLPGVLERMKPSQRARLSPDVLAKLQEADLEAKNKKEASTALVKRTYDDKDFLIAKLKEQEENLKLILPKTKYGLKKMIESEKTKDNTKPMLVLFRGGGYIEAKEAYPIGPKGIHIEVDKSLTAEIPKGFLERMSNDA